MNAPTQAARRRPFKQPAVHKIAELDPAKALADGAQRRHSALRTEGGMLAFHCSLPDEGGVPSHGLHNHPYEQMLVMLTGSMMVQIEDRKVEMKAGEALVIPAFAFHTAWVTGDGPCSRIEMFAPVRHDLIPATANRDEGFAGAGEQWVRPGAMTWEDPPA